MSRAILAGFAFSASAAIVAAGVALAMFAASNGAAAPASVGIFAFGAFLSAAPALAGAAILSGPRGRSPRRIHR